MCFGFLARMNYHGLLWQANASWDGSMRDMMIVPNAINVGHDDRCAILLEKLEFKLKQDASAAAAAVACFGSRLPMEPLRCVSI